jgi:predicted enzyme related to lactoylglutathione lyase
MAANVVHFEVFVEDPERAKKFYTEVLGWAFRFIKEMNYTLVYPGGEVLDGPAKTGINGGMMLRPGPFPVTQDNQAAPNAFVCTIVVDDIDAVLAKVVPAGGKIDMPAGNIPGVGRFAYIRDTEFNVLGLLQPEMR